MLLYLFFDSLLSTCPKKMETEKWPKAADFPLHAPFVATVLIVAILANTFFQSSTNSSCWSQDDPIFDKTKKNI